jgi:hypothetical protein
VLNAGNAAAGHNIASGQLARGFGSDAAGNFAQTIQTEAPNAGWGAKAIAAAAGAAIGGAVGGVPGAQAGSQIGGVMYPGATTNNSSGYDFGGPRQGPGPGQPGYTGFGGGGGYYNPSYGNNPYQAPGGQPWQYGGGASPYNHMIFSYQPTAQQPTYWNASAPPTNYDIVPPTYKLPRQQARY